MSQITKEPASSKPLIVHSEFKPISWSLSATSLCLVGYKKNPTRYYIKRQKDLSEKVGITSQYLMMLDKPKTQNPSLREWKIYLLN